MTKSNVHTAVRRQMNRRIEQRYDPVQQNKTRAYQQRQRVRNPERKLLRQQVSDTYRRVMHAIGDFFSGFFERRSSRLLSNLDLRQSDVDRFGPFDPNRRRNVGASYLRAMFPNLGRMVSTRDGKRV